ncbi:MAG: FtsK/SpoIIIE domain-containing protein [Clostridia bacterium]
MRLKEILATEQKDESKFCVPIGTTASGEVVKINLESNGITVLGTANTGKSALQFAIIYCAKYFYRNENITFQILDMHDCRESEYKYYYGDAKMQKMLNITKIACGVSASELSQYLDNILEDIQSRSNLLKSDYKNIREYNASVQHDKKLLFVNICLTDAIVAQGATEKLIKEINDKIVIIRSIGYAYGYNLITFQHQSSQYVNVGNCSCLIVCRNAFPLISLETLGIKNIVNLDSSKGECYIYNYKNSKLLKMNLLNIYNEKKDENYDCSNDLLELYKLIEG